MAADIKIVPLKNKFISLDLDLTRNKHSYLQSERIRRWSWLFWSLPLWRLSVRLGQWIQRMTKRTSSYQVKLGWNDSATFVWRVTPLNCVLHTSILHMSELFTLEENRQRKRIRTFICPANFKQRVPSVTIDGITYAMGTCNPLMSPCPNVKIPRCISTRKFRSNFPNVRCLCQPWRKVNAWRQWFTFYSCQALTISKIC